MFFHRSAPTGTAIFVLVSTAFAQSTVRPLPRAAVPTAMAWSLALPPRPTAAPTAPTMDDFLPPTTLEGLERSEEPGREFALAPYLVLHSDADVEGPGSAAIQRGGWDARAGWKTGDGQGFLVTLHTEASFYDFEDATGLVPGSGNGEPLNDVYETSLGATLCTRYTEDLGWFASGAVTLSGEDHAALGEAISVATVGGVRYQASDEVALQAGLAVQTLLEDRSWIIPYLGFEWRISERVRLASEGSKLRLETDLDPAWKLYGEAAYEIRQYRLNATNPLPEGVMRDEEIDLSLGLDWRPKPGLVAGLETGITAWREFELLDEDGGRASETETSPAPFAAFSLNFSF